MKQITLLLMIASVIMSCSKENTPPTTNNTTTTGTVNPTYQVEITAPAGTNVRLDLLNAGVVEQTQSGVIDDGNKYSSKKSFALRTLKVGVAYVINIWQSYDSVTVEKVRWTPTATDTIKMDKYVILPDTTAPVITILGPDPLSIKWTDIYYNFTNDVRSVDNIDGDISKKIIAISQMVLPVVKDTMYEVLYTSIDKHKNKAIKHRKLLFY